MTRVTMTGCSESDTSIAEVLRGYVDRFELTSPMVKQMMLDAATELERLKRLVEIWQQQAADVDTLRCAEIKQLKDYIAGLEDVLRRCGPEEPTP